MYTGITVNIENRLREHNSGKSPYAKLNRPFELIHFEKYETRKEAVLRERYLKSGKGRDVVTNILKAKQMGL